MLASITPLGERSRRQRWIVTVAAILAGGLAAGAASGAVAALVGARLPVGDGVRVTLVGALAAAGLLADLRFGGVRLPTHLRQVDETWLHRYRGWVYGLGFGAQLGVGLATVVTSSTVYVLVAAELLAPTVAVGAAAGALFGVTRALSVLLAAGVDSPQRLVAFHRRFHSLERPAASVVLAGQALVAAAAFLAAT